MERIFAPLPWYQRTEFDPFRFYSHSAETFTMASQVPAYSLYEDRRLPPCCNRRDQDGQCEGTARMPFLYFRSSMQELNEYMQRGMTHDRHRFIKIKITLNGLCIILLF